ncbi:DUF4809 family protein [Vagococcus zengguangii]|nr:DUF4809 family protein [Vagococcus zengguangii]
MTKTAVLEIDYEMTDGGCNACVPFKAEIARLIIDEQTIAVGELTPEALIMAVALHEGFKQEMKFDILYDYLLFSRSDQQVKQQEDFTQWIYTNNNNVTVKTKKFYQEKSELLEHVNHVLVECFDLYPVKF